MLVFCLNPNLSVNVEWGQAWPLLPLTFIRAFVPHSKHEKRQCSVDRCCRLGLVFCIRYMYGGSVS